MSQERVESEQGGDRKGSHPQIDIVSLGAIDNATTGGKSTPMSALADEGESNPKGIDRSRAPRLSVESIDPEVKAQPPRIGYSAVFE